MRENLDRSRGVVFSGTILLNLPGMASRANKPMSGCSASHASFDDGVISVAAASAEI